MTDVLDWVVRVLAIVGLPSITTYFLRDRRKLRNENVETEATMPNRVRTSSVVALEAEIMALSNSFDTDRKIKDETIQFLTEQLAEAREDIVERDRKIDSLQSQLSGLKKDFNERISELEGELQSLRHNGTAEGNH